MLLTLCGSEELHFAKKHFNDKINVFTQQKKW